MTAAPAPAVQQTTLGERIATIAGEAAQEQIKATGKTEFGGRALSIADVDELLGPLMAKHGVISDYEFRRTPRVLYEQPTRNEGILRIWRVDIDGIIWDAASGEERRRRLHDIGSSPSGAVSFALKRWHRALFKIVEDDDQVEGQQASQQKAKRLDWKTLKCPLCGHVGAVVERRDKTSWWCVPDKGGCNGSIKGEQADAMVAAATGAPPAATADEQPAPASDATGESCGKCGVIGAIARIPNAPAGGKVAFCKRDLGGCGAYLTADQIVAPTGSS